MTNNNRKLNMKEAVADIKAVSMSHTEKKLIKSRLAHVIGAKTKSVWSVYDIKFWSESHRFAFSTVAVLLLVFLAGGGIVSASGRALPGDTLYAMKVSVVEPVIGAFEVSPVEKANWQATLVTARLSEVEILASEGRLDESKQAHLEQLLDEHTVAYVNAVKKVENEESAEKADEIDATLRLALREHAKRLDDISNRDDEDGVAPVAVATAMAPQASPSAASLPGETALVSDEIVVTFSLMSATTSVDKDDSEDEAVATSGHGSNAKLVAPEAEPVKSVEPADAISSEVASTEVASTTLELKDDADRREENRQVAKRFSKKAQAHAVESKESWSEPVQVEMTKGRGRK